MRTLTHYLILTFLLAACENAGPSLLGGGGTPIIAVPTVTFGTPTHSTINLAITSIQIPITIANATATTLSSSDITFQPLSGKLACTITVTNVSITGATANVSDCLAGGTFDLIVNAGVATNANGDQSAASAPSSIITLDLFAPSIVSLTPASGSVGSLPPVVASFSESIVQMVAANFVVTGTCATLPSVTTPVMGASNVYGPDSNATIELVNGVCGNGDTVTVTVDPTAVTDLNGNPGTGAPVAVTYSIVVDVIPPTLTSLTPDTATLTAVPATVTATFSEAVQPLTTSSFVITGTCGTLPTATNLTMSPGATTATVNLSGAVCSDQQTVHVTVDPTLVKDIAGNSGTGSPVSVVYTIQVDTTPPTVVSLTPATATVGSIPASVVLTLSEAVNTVTAGDFAVTGTCTTLPTVGTPVMSNNGTVATASLVGGSCANAQTLTVSVNAANITDLAGNAGSGTTSDTYTFSIDTTPPTLLSFTPADETGPNMPASIVLTFSEAITGLAANNFAITGTCGTLPTLGDPVMSGGNTVGTLSLSGAACGPGQSVTVGFDTNTVSDLAGNQGADSTTQRTYTNGTLVITGATPGDTGDFGTLTNASPTATQNFVVTNNTANATTSLNVLLSPTSNWFTIVSTTCTSPLASQATCTIQVQASGSYCDAGATETTTLFVNYTRGGPQLSLPLTVLDNTDGCRMR